MVYDEVSMLLHSRYVFHATNWQVTLQINNLIIFQTWKNF